MADMNEKTIRELIRNTVAEEFETEAAEVTFEVSDVMPLVQRASKTHLDKVEKEVQSTLEQSLKETADRVQGDLLARVAANQKTNKADLAVDIAKAMSEAIEVVTEAVKVMVDEELRSTPKAARPARKRKVMKKLSSKGARTQIEEILEERCYEGMTYEDGANPLALISEHGLGKTFAVRKHAGERLDEVQCHAGMDAIDLLGGVCPDKKGNFRPVDGDVTASFRKAQGGQWRLLALDELFRMPTKVVNVILSALSATPIPEHARETINEENAERGIEPFPEGTMCYPLKVPLLKEERGETIKESIYAPVEFLAIVMSSNEGGDYEVSQLDPAMASRIRRFTIRVCEKQVELVVGLFVEEKVETCDPFQSKKWADKKTKIVEVFVDFWKKMRDAKAKQSASMFYAPSPREMSAVIRSCSSPAKLKDEVLASKEYWCGRDEIKGGPLDIHVRVVEECASVFNALR
jgi:hypothetical protein